MGLNLNKNQESKLSWTLLFMPSSLSTHKVFLHEIFCTILMLVDLSLGLLDKNKV